MCCCLVLLVFSSSITSVMDSEASKELKHCCICGHVSEFHLQLDKHVRYITTKLLYAFYTRNDKNDSYLRRHAAAQTFVIYRHLVSIGCPSRTSA